MEGVILFADDHIHGAERAENKLFNYINQKLPVLGVHTLDLAKEALKAIGSFRAVILDWQFSNEIEDDFKDVGEELGIKTTTIAPSTKEDAALKFLDENDFYSLIYILSEEDIEENTEDH